MADSASQTLAPKKISNPLTREINSEKLIKWLVFAIYAAVGVVLVLCHENWRDEAQSWLLVRQLNVSQLFGQLSYEGHPCLWYLVLLPFAKLGFPTLS